MIVGHKPSADCPAVLSSHYTGLEIVSADTSFSDTSAKDNRGLAVSVVEVVGSSAKDNQLHLHGTLMNGKRYSSKFSRLHSGDKVDTSHGDGLLGRQLTDGSNWWIKVKTESGEYCLTRGKGRKVEHRYSTEVDALSEMLF